MALAKDLEVKGLVEGFRQRKDENITVAEKLKVKVLTPDVQITNAGERPKHASKLKSERSDIQVIKRMGLAVLPTNDNIQEVVDVEHVKTEPITLIDVVSLSKTFTNEGQTPFANTIVAEPQEGDSNDQGYDHEYEKETTAYFEPSPVSLNSLRQTPDQKNYSKSQDPEGFIYFDRDPEPGSRKKWRCKLCVEYAHNRGNAMNHVEAKHLNVNYDCDQCNKNFRSRNSLKTHVSINHI